MTEERTAELLDVTSRKLAHEAVKQLIEKKAQDIRLFCVNEVSSVTDYYVNVTGRSLTHVASLADELVYNLDMRGRSALRIEGKRGNSWILVDYGDVIVNIFDTASRSFYNFDRLLPEESAEDITALVAEVDEKFS